MLMALSVAPVAWGMLKKVPPAFAGTGVPPLLLLSTLVPIVAISLFAGPLLQLWAPLIGVLIGSTVAWIYEASSTPRPSRRRPGSACRPRVGRASPQPGPAFWALPVRLRPDHDGGVHRDLRGRPRRPAHVPPDPAPHRLPPRPGGDQQRPGQLHHQVPGHSARHRLLDERRRHGAHQGRLPARGLIWGGLSLVLLSFSPRLGAVVGALPTRSPVATS